MNNNFQAFRITNISTISDEKLIAMNKKMAINLFSSKITYIVTSIESTSFKLNIT